MSSHRHVEIVGGGLAGLTAATAFAQKGWSVRLHERMDQIRAVGSGLSLHENCLRVLRALGAEESAIRGGWMGEVYQSWDKYGRVTSSRRRRRMYEVTRAKLMNALIAAAERAGAEIVLGSTVAGVEPEGVIRMDNGQAHRADLVVVADGVGSRLRDQLGIPYRRTKMQDGTIRTMAPRLPHERTGPKATTSGEYWSGHRRLLVVPTSDDEIYVALTTLNTDEAGKRVPIDKEVWSKSFPAAQDVIERLNGEARWDRFENIRMSSWSKGRVVVLGDAAHAMAPNLGQGGACGMMNGLSLAAALEEPGELFDILNSWERRERPLTDHTQSVSKFYSDLAYWPNAPRAAVLWAISKVRILNKQATRCAAHIPTGTEHLPVALSPSFENALA